MAIVKVLEHKCLQKIEGYIPPGTRCGCRKWVTTAKAAVKVEEGDAAYVITEMRVSEVDEPCRLCGGLDGFKKYCGACLSLGFVKIRKLFTVLGENIYLVSAKKTPRTATVERAHVERAITAEERASEKRQRRFVRQSRPLNEWALIEHHNSILDAQSVDSLDQNDYTRIEIYGNMAAEILGELGAQVIDTKTGEIVKPGKPEPKDDASKGEGERYDYGRSV